ncbi:MAG: GNAT family N-acetyltransferase [bacterium]|nr:GNAT family N-acetyltransferase [bacterium]
MEINFKEDKIVWDKFVETSPHRSIFITTAFLDSLGAKYDLVTCREGQEILAGAVIIFDKNGEPMMSAHKFTQYQGLILADNSKMPAHSKTAHEFATMEFFINELVLRYKKFYLCQHWRFNDMRPFLWYNYHEPKMGQFKIQLRYTPIIDKKSYNVLDSFLSGIRRNRKREYLKAKEFLTISSIADESIMDRLHDDVFKRQGIERADNDSVLVKSITKKALADNFGSLKSALKDGESIASLLTLQDNRSSFFLFGATDSKYRDLGGYTYLSVEMIKDAFESGCQEVDIVGANSPNRSDYKISFNAELKPYFEIYFGN